MKKLVILIILIISNYSFSQKKELRQVNKLISESFFDEAANLLNEIGSLIDNSDLKVKAQFYFYSTKVNLELKNFSKAIQYYDLLKSINNSNYSSAIRTEFDFLFNQIETVIVNSAVEDNKIQLFIASDKLLMAYRMNEEKNKDYLYYAAGSAVNSKNMKST